MMRQASVDRFSTRSGCGVDGSLRLPGADQSASITSSKRIDVTWTDEIVGSGIGIGEQLDRLRPIAGTDAGSHAVSRVTIDADGERGLAKAGVVRSLRLQFEPFTGLHVERHAEISRSDAGQEIDHLGSGEFGGNHEVALVFTILVIDENDDAAVADVFDDFGDR